MTNRLVSLSGTVLAALLLVACGPAPAPSTTPTSAPTQAATFAPAPTPVPSATPTPVPSATPTPVPSATPTAPLAPPPSQPVALFVVSGSVTSFCDIPAELGACGPDPVGGASLLITGTVTVSIVSSSTGTFSTQLPAGQYTLTPGPVVGLFAPTAIVFNVLVNQPVAPIDIVYIVDCPNC